jgi:hypothetical protein
MTPSDSSSGIRDNQLHGSVKDYLASAICPGSSLSFVSAYFTIHAYVALAEQLESIESLRFLFGDPTCVRSIDPKATGKAFRITDQGLLLTNTLLQREAARRCQRWLESKAEIRSIRHANLLHGKLFHIHDGHRDFALLGSSNFTGRGLGVTTNSNIELNLVVDSDRDRQELHAWFNALWRNSELVEDVKQQVLDHLRQLYASNDPQFIYYKTLFHLFDSYLLQQDQDKLLQDVKLVETGIWQALFEFQKDGAKGAINKINQHGGCILADSVGLGKTYEALAVIKHFELQNDRVLVLCPKKLRENWTVYQAHANHALNPFAEDRFGYTVLCHTDLSRDEGRSGDIDLANFNWGVYDLVVIDESHNFRNNVKGKRDEEGQVIRKSRYERLMEDILRAGRRTKVLLLSATPVNNDLKDLLNQIYLITESEDAAFKDSLGIDSLKDTLAEAQRTFGSWARSSGERHVGQLVERLSSGFFTLLDALTIARSRSHVTRYYQDSLQKVGSFPERRSPISIHPNLDLLDSFMSYDQLNEEIEKYDLSLFKPSKHLKEEFKAHYQQRQREANFSQESRERYLIGMMKVNFLKRLESSVHAFTITMQRTMDKISLLEQRIDHFNELALDPELDLDNLDLADVEDTELREALTVGKGTVYQLAHLRLEDWKRDLQNDRTQIQWLAAKAAQIGVSRDAKLKDLKSLLLEKANKPTKDKLSRPNRKALVFTAFADTATYLYDALKDWARQELGLHIALVSGGAGGCKTTWGKADYQSILTHFSPHSRKREQMASLPKEQEIDLLIATDCISEGQNLQDCDLLINYDIHWNPVRIIQRFGRIDRIGSINNHVQLVNFWPVEDLNKYINLKNRVEARMALVDLAATAEDNVLSPEELQDLVTQDLKYRDKQLMRLKDEVLDLEDLGESLSLSEFSLEDFRLDLLQYIQANRDKLVQAPPGLFAVVPPLPDQPQAAPGVIWCLRQLGETEGSESVNPLRPHFLVYVRDDGTVRYAFTQPKQILELYRRLCSGKAEPWHELCDLFDARTAHGADMSQAERLLKSAVESISRTFQRRMTGGLLASRGGRLLDASRQASSEEQFELLTWLVILDPAEVVSGAA